jgi:hypothetical protein
MGLLASCEQHASFAVEMCRSYGTLWSASTGHTRCLSQEEQQCIVVGVALTCTGTQFCACGGCRGGKAPAYRCRGSWSAGQIAAAGAAAAAGWLRQCSDGAKAGGVMTAVARSGAQDQRDSAAAVTAAVRLAGRSRKAHLPPLPATRRCASRRFRPHSLAHVLVPSTAQWKLLVC